MSVAFIIVIMTAINCCSNKYDQLLPVFQIKRARIQRGLRKCDNFLLQTVYSNNNEKFRSFKSKENIYKKEVGPIAHFKDI